MGATGFDSIHNHFERLVFDEVRRLAGERAPHLAADALADVACVALNRLPPRYIRHAVDHAFYLTAAERDDYQRRVEIAVAQAFGYVAERPGHAAA